MCVLRSVHLSKYILSIMYLLFIRAAAVISERVPIKQIDKVATGPNS